MLYARVCGPDQRADQDRQVCGLTGWATSSGFTVGRVVCEVGSGLDGRRAKLDLVLSDPSATVVVVEYRDWLARLGVQRVQSAFPAHGRRIVGVDAAESADGVVRDMVEFLTWMCARRYARRGSRNGVLRAVTVTRRQPQSVGAAR